MMDSQWLLYDRQSADAALDVPLWRNAGCTDHMRTPEHSALCFADAERGRLG